MATQVDPASIRPSVRGYAGQIQKVEILRAQESFESRSCRRYRLRVLGTECSQESARPRKLPLGYHLRSELRRAPAREASLSER